MNDNENLYEINGHVMTPRNQRRKMTNKKEISNSNDSVKCFKKKVRKLEAVIDELEVALIKKADMAELQHKSTMNQISIIKEGIRDVSNEFKEFRKESDDVTNKKEFKRAKKDDQ